MALLRAAFRGVPSLCGELSRVIDEDREVVRDEVEVGGVSVFIEPTRRRFASDERKQTVVSRQPKMHDVGRSQSIPAKDAARRRTRPTGSHF